MLTGGSEAPLSCLAYSTFANMRALSRREGDPKEASRPFDLNRDGFVLGEGAGVLVLEDRDALATCETATKVNNRGRSC